MQSYIVKSDWREAVWWLEKADVLQSLCQFIGKAHLLSIAQQELNFFGCHLYHLHKEQHTNFVTAKNLQK